MSLSLAQNTVRRSPRSSAGHRSKARWWCGWYSWSGLGTTYGAERCSTVSVPTLSTMPGTNWIALAPVPTTTTRLLRRSTSWRHCAEWKAGPAKESAPGSDGTTGFESCPTAETTRSASYVVPSAHRTDHVPLGSSRVQATTSASVTTRSVRPSRSDAARR